MPAEAVRCVTAMHMIVSHSVGGTCDFLFECCESVQATMVYVIRSAFQMHEATCSTVLVTAVGLDQRAMLTSTTVPITHVTATERVMILGQTRTFAIVSRGGPDLPVTSNPHVLLNRAAFTEPVWKMRRLQMVSVVSVMRDGRAEFATSISTIVPNHRKDQVAAVSMARAATLAR